MLDTREDFKDITLLYGARTPVDLTYQAELPEWSAREDVNTVLCVDNDYPGWEHKVGLIPNVLLEMNPSPENTVAITCGPPIMIKFTLQALKKVGICGRCNMAPSMCARMALCLPTPNSNNCHRNFRSDYGWYFQGNRYPSGCPGSGITRRSFLQPVGGNGNR
jgi:NAD(P)H-flavin reductase